MRRIEVLGGAALFAALFPGGAASADAAPEAPGTVCAVSLDRTSSPDTFGVTRQQLDDGSCVCYVRTGPRSQSRHTEAAIAELERRRDCVARPQPGALVDGAPNHGAIGVYAGAAAVGGLIAAFSSGGADSPGG